MTNDEGSPNIQITRAGRIPFYHYSDFVIPSSFVIRPWSFFLILFLALPSLASAQSISRAEALRIAESYIQHRWEASAKNSFHGKDAKGIEVHTPDRAGGRGKPLSECWRVD